MMDYHNDNRRQKMKGSREFTSSIGLNLKFLELQRGPLVKILKYIKHRNVQNTLLYQKSLERKKVSHECIAAKDT